MQICYFILFPFSHNSFRSTGPFLYPLKKLQNQRFP